MPSPKERKWRAKQKLELIHIDISGPMKTFSLNGSRYYVLFIDDITSLCWVYFLKKKIRNADEFPKVQSFNGESI